MLKKKYCLYQETCDVPFQILLFCTYCYLKGPGNQIITNNGKLWDPFFMPKSKIAYCCLLWPCKFLLKSERYLPKDICGRGLIMLCGFETNWLVFQVHWIPRGSSSHRPKQLHSVCPECRNFLKILWTF